VCYQRKETYPLNIVFEYIFSNKEVKEDNSRKYHIFDGDRISMTSIRYRVFKFVSYKCKDCGLVGEYFAKERHHHPNSIDQSYHFNLYGHNKNGDEIMLTKDHIKPKSFGGQNVLMNMECMCKKCNEKKGNEWNGHSGC